MLMEFFNNSVQQSFLKSLLSAVQLPKFKIIKDDQLIFKDYYYIYKTHIIKCTETGYINPIENTVSNSILGQDIITKTEAKYDQLDHYYFSNMNQNIEFKEFIRASYYSTELHKRLGDYLRVLRDLYNVDLMGLYNCFSYELFSDVYIKFTPQGNINDIVNGVDKTKKVLAIPIKFNTIYTIAVTSQKPVYISPILKLPSGKFSIRKISNNYTPNLGPQLLESSDFYSPITIKFDLNYNQSDIYQYEKYLYMILQLDSNNDSSVVVLEGDHTNDDNIQIINSEFADQNDTISLMYKPRLLDINDGISYAYSDTIIEYLLHNAVINTDIIGDNISYNKKLLGFSNDVNYWTNNIKYAGYMKYLLDIQSNDYDIDEYKNQDLSKLRYDCYDVTGYLDKQIEEYLNG